MRPAAWLLSLGMLSALGLQVSRRAPSSLSPGDTLPVIRANDNQTPAGRLRHRVLSIRLTAQKGVWYPEDTAGPGIVVYALAEEGRLPENPGPLIRVPEGTEVRATVRNVLPRRTLVVHGLHTRPGIADDTFQVAAGAAREVRFMAGVAGTYYYWATATGARIEERNGEDSQLSGALIVDPQERQPRIDDRVFVIGVWIGHPDSNASRRGAERRVLTINGRSWPHTESLSYGVGDSVRWRWINPSDRPHPMHLHGFYYRVESKGDGERDTLYGDTERRWVVTERMQSGSTMSLTWAPDRPGNWIFHCHTLAHIAPTLRLGRSGAHARVEPWRATEHASEEMAGLVTGVHILPGRHVETTDVAEAPKKFRLLVQAHPGRYGPDPGLGFVLWEGAGNPAPDSIAIPGPPIVLTRGQHVSITILNRLREPTTVHWHGIEIESYYDGVAGWSGRLGQLAPAIAPGDSFVVRLRPRRAGTFIYHTHIDDLRQLSSGLYGPLIVLEPRQSFDSTTDRILLFSRGGLSDSAPVLLNGQSVPAAIELRAGVRYRLRLISILPDNGVAVSLFGDSSLANWRALAKDGADLPAAQARVRPATQVVSVGETYDFEFFPMSAGDLRLQANALFKERRMEGLEALVRVR